MAIFQSHHEEGIRADGKTETIIGPSVTVEGDFKGEGDVIVAGTVKGTLTTKQNLIIKEGAVIHADIGAQRMLISGEVRGNILAKDQIEVTKTAKIFGDMEAAVISVEPGAHLEGRCVTQIAGQTEMASSSKKELKPAKSI